MFSFVIATCRKQMILGDTSTFLFFDSPWIRSMYTTFIEMHESNRPMACVFVRNKQLKLINTTTGALYVDVKSVTWRHKWNGTIALKPTWNFVQSTWTVHTFDVDDTNNNNFVFKICAAENCSIQMRNDWSVLPNSDPHNIPIVDSMRINKKQ